MLGLSALLGAVAAALGFWWATVLDASIAGCMAVAVGVVFGVVFLVAPGRGLLSVLQRRRRQRWRFAQLMLAIHLWQHEGSPDEAEESRVDHLHGKHVGWTPAFTRRVVMLAVRGGLVEREGDRVRSRNCALRGRGRRRRRSGRASRGGPDVRGGRCGAKRLEWRRPARRRVGPQSNNPFTDDQLWSSVAVHQ